jgi:FkbM family methyltransferase
MLTHPHVDPAAPAELKFWLAMTRRLPQMKGCGKLCALMMKIYNRRKRPDTAVDVFGARMILDPSDCVEGQLLFSPHLYDRHEVACLRAHLKRGDTFVDAGANVGFYSFLASDIVGPHGRVIAIEADPATASRLTRNLELSEVKNVRLVNAGLSDAPGVLKLGRDVDGNRGGNSFLYDSPHTVDVECRTLAGVLTAEKVFKVDGAKFDIEGFEFKVLKRFFEEAKRDLWPRFFIVEHIPSYDERAGGSSLELLAANGYRVQRIKEHNYLAVRE